MFIASMAYSRDICSYYACFIHVLYVYCIRGLFTCHMFMLSMDYSRAIYLYSHGLFPCYVFILSMVDTRDICLLHTWILLVLDIYSIHGLFACYMWIPSMDNTCAIYSFYPWVIHMIYVYSWIIHVLYIYFIHGLCTCL